MALSAIIGALRVNLGLDTAQFNAGLKSAQGSLGRFGGKLRSAGRSLSLSLTAPITAFAGISAKVAGDFEAQMNRVQAVSGATGEQFEQLRNQAKELGATTKFTAAQAADAMGFLAMAGFEATEILGAMPSTLQLAAAANIDLGTAADITSNILTGYRMEVSELAKANDVLVAAFTSANTDLTQLGDAMKFVGPVASAAGVSFTETAAAIGLMGNAGIQGEMAGTALRGAIARMLNPTSGMADAMEEAGLVFTDAAGRLLPLADIVDQLSGHAENAGLFMELFAQRAGPGMVALAGQGSAALVELTQNLADSGGTAQRIADTQMRGFNGAMLELKSAVEGLMIAIADSGILEAFTMVAKKLTEVIRAVSEANPQILKITTVFALVAAAIGPVVIGLGVMAIAIGAIGVPVAAAIAAITAITAALVIFWEDIVGLGEAIGNFLSGAWQRMVDAFDATVGTLGDIGRAFVDFHLVALDAVVKLASGVIEWLRDKLGPVWRAVSAGVELVVGSFKGMYEAVVGNSYVPDMVDRIEEEFGRLDSVMVQPAESAADGVTGAFEGVFSNIGSEITGPFRDALTSGRASFSSFADAIVSIGERMADQLINNAFNVIEQELNDLFSGARGGGAGGGGGGGGGIIGALSSAIGGLFKFQHGGSFTVGGRAGIDNNLVMFKASRGEQVTVTPQDERGRGFGPLVGSIPITINGGNPDEMRRSAGFISREILEKIRQAQGYG